MTALCRLCRVRPLIVASLPARVCPHCDRGCKVPRCSACASILKAKV